MQNHAHGVAKRAVRQCHKGRSGARNGPSWRTAPRADGRRGNDVKESPRHGGHATALARRGRQPPHGKAHGCRKATANNKQPSDNGKNVRQLQLPQQPAGPADGRRHAHGGALPRGRHAPRHILLLPEQVRQRRRRRVPLPQRHRPVVLVGQDNAEEAGRYRQRRHPARATQRLRQSGQKAAPGHRRLALRHIPAPALRQGLPRMAHSGSGLLPAALPRRQPTRRCL